MDLVIKRLSSIEEASAGIIEAAENEKKALEQQMREPMLCPCLILQLR